MATRIRLNVTLIRTLPVLWRSGTFRILKACGSYGDVDSDSSPLGRYAVIINSYGVTPAKDLNLHTAITECGESNI